MKEFVFFSTFITIEDPKKMFTDSSFYNSKYHPTIADQVEMAHKLSSAMFNEQNKGTKGAKMYLTRMENSGELMRHRDCLEFFSIRIEFRLIRLTEFI